MNTLKLSASTLATTLVVLTAGAAQATIPYDLASKPVRPVLEGVYACPNGTYAVFGYKNENTDTVEIPVGPYNRFAPNLQNRQQPTLFVSGRSYNTFSVKLNEDTLVWILGTPQGKIRTSTASIAKAQAINICPF